MEFAGFCTSGNLLEKHSLETETFSADSIICGIGTSTKTRLSTVAPVHRVLSLWWNSRLDLIMDGADAVGSFVICSPIPRKLVVSLQDDTANNPCGYQFLRHAIRNPLGRSCCRQHGSGVLTSHHRVRWHLYQWNWAGKILQRDAATTCYCCRLGTRGLLLSKFSEIDRALCLEPHAFMISRTLSLDAAPVKECTGSVRIFLKYSVTTRPAGGMSC